MSRKNKRYNKTIWVDEDGCLYEKKQPNQVVIKEEYYKYKEGTETRIQRTVFVKENPYIQLEIKFE